MRFIIFLAFISTFAMPASATPSNLKVEPSLPPAMIAAIEEENNMSAHELRLIPNGSVSWKGGVVGAAAFEVR